MDSKKLFSSVFFGLTVIYVFIAFFSLIFSLLLKFTSIQESDLNLAITIVSFIALFIGGFFAGGKGKERGWLIGIMTGLFYTFINFLFQYLGHDMPVTLNQIIYYVCFNLTIIMGAILGVNISGGSTREA